LLARVVAPASADEGAAEEATVAAMVTAALGAVESDRHGSATRRWVARTAIAAAVLIAGTGSAAAAGALPDAAQSAIARVTSHVGLVLPDPNATVHPAPTPTHPHATTTSEPRPTTTSSTPSTTATTAPVATAGTTTTITVPTAEPAAPAPESSESAGATGPRLDGPAKQGLCTAWDAHRRSGKPDPQGTAFVDLDAAAAAAGQSVADFCAPVLATTPKETKEPKEPKEPTSVEAPPTTAARPAHRKPTATSAAGPTTQPAATHPPHPTRPAKPDDTTP